MSCTQRHEPNLALHIEDLTVAYEGRPVLWDIDVNIPPGVMAAIIGPNGAGKTTLAAVVANEMGVNFSTPLDSKLWMGFGLYYLKAKNTLNSSLTGDGQEYNLNNQTEIIHLPVNWQYNLTDWFGLKVGLSIGIELKDDDNLNQNGLGFTGGAVIHYSPLPWLDAGIEPSFHLTSILPIPEEFHQKHFLLSGTNTYVAFKF